jgi:hypothetical protein
MNPPGLAKGQSRTALLSAQTIVNEALEAATSQDKSTA